MTSSIGNTVKQIEDTAACSDHYAASRESTPANLWDDDNVEYVEIPGRGKLQIQIFETRTRVHCYFDPEEATWLRLPIAWELNTPAARHLIGLVKDVCPGWAGDSDILAALRASNYNVDDCVNTYHSSIGRGCATVEAIPEETKPPLDNSIEHDACEPAEFPHDMEGGENNLSRACDKSEAEILDITFEETHAHLDRRLKSISDELEQLQSKNSFNLGKAHSLEASTNRIRSDCQAISDIVDGLKRSAEKLQCTLKPLLEKARALYLEQHNKLLDTQAMYRIESQQRRLIYNTLIEMRGNIRVFCRIRPAECPFSQDCWLQPQENGELTAHISNASKRKFEFDQVFNTDASQEEVFSHLSDIIASAIDGYNVCIMAYGQTGSGKTYTMEGPANDPGVNILSIRELLRLVNTKQRVTFELSISILEIYNENVVDLLSTGDSCEPVEIRHSNQSVCIVGANWIPVKNEADMYRAISMGQKSRHVAETKLNSSSSRSHLIVTVNVVGTDKISGSVSRGQLTLCDLAGSERVEKSGATSGERFQEATHINRSLSALAQVFVALRKNNLHIPYRNTKLTQLLQPCLGGDAKTCLIVNVTTDLASVSETLSTLQFGTNARQVALGPVRPNTTPTNS